MLEEFITNESKSKVSNAYVYLYERTTPYYAIRTFNKFNNKYTYRHILENQNVIGFEEYGKRKAKVFERYVNMAVHKYNPDVHDNMYVLHEVK